MNTPITSNFFKKIELYQELTFQDNLFKKSLLEPDQTHYTNSTWIVEKKILYWSRWGHKHLGSPIVIGRFYNDSDLSDMKLTKKEMKVAGIRESMQNLVQRGYACYFDKEKKEDLGILLSGRGLLMGAVIYEISKPEAIDAQHLWEKYKLIYSADTYLKRKYRYWFYKLIIAVGWLAFICGLFLIIQQTIKAL